ncbi:MAG TPA: methyltransferase [Bryobacteraceae bacterium]|jgi:precorrin-6B methylase 2
MSATDAPAVTPERIMQLVWGYAPAVILAAAINNSVFDLLDAGPKTVEELAKASGSSERGLRAILNALTAFQFVAKTPDQRYALTPESAAFLVSSKPGYLGKYVEFNALKLLPTWLRLPDVVRAGKPVEAVGEEFFADLVEPIFTASYATTQTAAKALDLASTQGPISLLDIGAGAGVWGIGLAQHSPHISVTAVDWPAVLDVTKCMAARFGMPQRFSYIEGNFQSVDFGRDHNLVTVGHILHGEGAEGSRALLKKAFDALAPGGRIVISEFLVNDDRTGPPAGLIFAVNMLVHTNAGDTFSFEEISGWLKEAGFANARRIDPPGPVSIILAAKP